MATVAAGANVCSVRFNPWHEHLIAVGSAAHTALVYDLRMLRGTSSSGGAGAALPLASFGGHKKAVAYVRWAGEQELLSASTGACASAWMSMCVTIVCGQLMITSNMKWDTALISQMDSGKRKCVIISIGFASQGIHTWSVHVSVRVCLRVYGSACVPICGA